MSITQFPITTVSIDDAVSARLDALASGNKVVLNNSIYSNNLALAVSSIGTSNKVDLYIDADTSVTTDLVVPSNIRIIIEQNAIVTVSNSKMLTITNFAPTGMGKRFSTTGTVKLNVPMHDITWWTGIVPSDDHTASIEAALRSIRANGGGTLLLPPFRLRTTGLHSIPNYTHVMGAEYDPDAATGYGFLLTHATNDHVLYVNGDGGYIKSVSLTGFCINVNASTSGTHKAIKMYSGDPNGAVSCTFSVSVNAVSAAAGTVCFYYQNNGSNFYAEIMNLNRCFFTAALNSDAVYLANPNNSFTVQETIFQLPAGSTGVHCFGIGVLKVHRCAFNGPSIGTAPFTEAPSGESLTGSITTGTNVLTGSRAFIKDDLGQRVVIAGKLDSYVKDIDDGGKAIVNDNATGTATTETLVVYRHSDTKNPTLAAHCVKLDNLFVDVEISNCQDEGVNYFLKTTTDWFDGIISLKNNLIQSFVRVEGDCTIQSSHNRYYSLTYEAAGATTCFVNSFADIIAPMIIWNGNWINRFLTNPQLPGHTSGNVLVVSSEFNSYLTSSRIKIQRNVEMVGPFEGVGLTDLTKPMLAIGSPEYRPLLRIGESGGATEKMRHYYDASRDPNTGSLYWNVYSPGFPEYASYSFIGGPVITDGHLIGTPTRPAQLTTDVSNYAAGHTHGGGMHVFINASTPVNIRSWYINQIQIKDGITRFITNNGTNAITFKHEDLTGGVGVTLRFRVKGATDLVLNADETLMASYDDTIARWRIVKIG